jgi:hypothetical protein
MNSMTKDTNTKVNSKAKLKLKELGEFLDVLKKSSDQFCWAMDFTSFPEIQEWCGKVLDVVEEVKDQVDNEFDYLDTRLAEYEFELAQFEHENEVMID